MASLRRPLVGFVVLLLSLNLVGCGGPTATERIVGPAATAAPTAASTVGQADAPTSSPAATRAAAGWVSEQDGARLEMRPATDTVATADVITFSVSLTNERDTPLQFGRNRSGCFAYAYIDAFIPLEPIGRTDWTGEAAAYKHRILTGTGGPPEHPYVEELSAGSGRLDSDCLDGDGITQPLAPGETATASFTWTASFGDALPVAPPSATFRALAFISPHDTLVTPPPPPTNYLTSRWYPGFREFWLIGTVGITGEIRPMASLGEIVDGALADETFLTFITKHPVNGCLVSLTLPGEQGRYLPAGPGWNLEEFCDKPRRFIRAEIDPWTAEVKGLDICNLCGR